VRFVQHFKQATGYLDPSLWQRSYFDHVVRREEALEGMANYTWTNPVRSGLVSRIRDYPWLGPTSAIGDVA
jgi:hypothetical protein